MKFETEKFQAAQLRLVDLETDHLAPMALWGPLMHFAGNEVIEASHCAEDAQPELVTWRVAWLTPTRLVYVEASKAIHAGGRWTGHDSSAEQVANSLEAWVQPLREVTSIALDNVELHPRPTSSDDWVWDAAHVATFRDGTTITIPFDGSITWKNRTSVEFFGSALRDAMTDQ